MIRRLILASCGIAFCILWVSCGFVLFLPPCLISDLAFASILMNSNEHDSNPLFRSHFRIKYCVGISVAPRPQNLIREKVEIVERSI